MTKGTTFVAIAGFAGTALFIGQLKAGAGTGEVDFARPIASPATDATPDALYGVGVGPARRFQTSCIQYHRASQ